MTSNSRDQSNLQNLTELWHIPVEMFQPNNKSTFLSMFIIIRFIVHSNLCVSTVQNVTKTFYKCLCSTPTFIKFQTNSENVHNTECVL